jgi:hypothetical protein
VAEAVLVSVAVEVAVVDLFVEQFAEQSIGLVLLYFLLPLNNIDIIFC